MGYGTGCPLSQASVGARGRFRMLQVQRRIQGTFSLLMVVISFISSSAYGNSPPSFTTDVNSPLVVEENTPPGTIVSTLEGVDPEGSKVKYGIYGTDRFSLDRDSGELRVAQPLDREVSTIVLDTSTIVLTLEGVDPEGSKVKYGIYGTDRFSLDRDSGELRVAQPLDREVNDTLQFTVTLEDEVEGEGVSNNVVEVPISVILIDQNDNSPVFLNTPYEVVVPEDAPVGKIILDSIRVEDPDLGGESIEVTCHEHLDSGDACSKFVLVSDASSTNLYTGSLMLNSTLDFAQTQFYRLVLEATDGHHTSKTNVDIRVGDVQNTPPIFINSSFNGEIMESAPIGSVVLRVEAKDGDLAQPRSIYYDLLTNPDEFFLIDSNTGELKTAKPLDREILGGTNGVISLTVRAREMVDGKPLQEDQATAFAQVTVTILDVNDSPPVFNRKEYVVHIPEDIPDGSLLPDLDMIVTDSDLDVSKSFSVEPDTAIGFTKVSIRVHNGSRLDYEDPNQRKYIILVIAEETHTAEKLSSSATLIVQVTDVNDNVPSFELNAYTGNVLETAQAGTGITTITALDSDGGDYGTGGIVYELLALDSDGGDYGTGGIVYELLALDSDGGDYGTGGIVYELLALDSDGGDYGTGGIVYELLALDSDGGDYGTGGIVYELLALDSDGGDYGTGGIVYELLGEYGIMYVR
ncbi:hypothetical protein M8J76_005956 [Diaphorina citri]|nr:hypothetical protein M8J76_005956 [Diaphorina citri]